MTKKHQHRMSAWLPYDEGYEFRFCLAGYIACGESPTRREYRMTAASQALWVVALSLWLKDHTAFEMVEKHEFQFCREWLRSLLDGA